jgi:glycosyltransferase involved in cell wall biosynthesis
MSPPPRILFDISPVYATDPRPPRLVERVEREIGRRLLADTSAPVIPVVFGGGLMYVVDRDVALEVLRRNCEPPRAREKAATDALQPTSPTSFNHRAQGAALRVATGTGRRVIKLTPAAYRPLVRQSLRTGRDAVLAIARSKNRGRDAAVSQTNQVESGAQVLPGLSTIVHPSRDDVVCICGPSIPNAPMRQLAEAKSDNGFRVASLCFDVSEPARQVACAPGLSGWLAAQLVDQIDASDLILCSSELVQRELEEFAVRIERPIPDSRLLALGADLPSRSAVLANWADESGPSSCHGRRFALAVGTVEARNNYSVLIESWELLSREPLFDLDLVIVGGPGDASAELTARINQSASLAERVHLLGVVDDDDMAWLHSRRHVFLCPRLDNVWAQPLAEAQQFDGPVICSNESAYRSIAGDGAILLDPLDVYGWSDAIRSIARRTSSASCARPGPTWNDAALSTRSALLSLVSAGTPAGT